MTATAAPTKPVCPSCGHFVRYLVQTTGFCRVCTNEHHRGRPAEPDGHHPANSLHTSEKVMSEDRATLNS